MLNVPKMETMSHYMFKNLVLNAFAEDSSIECVGIKAKFSSYEMGIYAWKSNNYALRIDDFGYSEKGKWVQCKPTLDQRATLEDLIAKEIKAQHDLEDEKLIAKQEKIQFKKDCYKYNEVGF